MPKISLLPPAGAITGIEQVPIVQGGVTKRTTVAALGGGGGSVTISFSDGTTTISSDTFTIQGTGSATVTVAGTTITIHTPEAVKSIGPAGTVQLSDGSGSFGSTTDLMYTAGVLQLTDSGYTQSVVVGAGDDFTIASPDGDDGWSCRRTIATGGVPRVTRVVLTHDDGATANTYAIHAEYSDGTTGNAVRICTPFHALDAFGVVRADGFAVSTHVGSSGTLGLGATVFGGIVTALGGGALPIGQGGTGETARNNAVNALLPDQAGHTAGEVLTTDGTDASWAAAGGGGDGDVSTTTSNTFTLGPQVVRTGADANRGIVVRRHSSGQSGDPYQYRDEADSFTYYKVDSGGHIFTVGNINADGTVRTEFIADRNDNVAYLDTSTDSTHGWTLFNRTASKTPLSIRGAASQTEDLQQWQDSSGTVLSRITAAGWPQNTPGLSRLAADATNATATMQTLGISVSLEAGHRYVGRLTVYASESTPLDGLAIDLDGGTAVMVAVAAGIVGTPLGATLGTAYTTTLGGDLTATTASAADVAYVIELSLEVSAAGTFAPRFAQVVHTTGTATVRAGSKLELWDSLT